MLGKKSVFYVVSLLLLLMVGWVALMLAFPYLVDAEKIRARTERQLYEATGYKIVIKRAEAMFRFAPTITFHNVTGRVSKKQLSPRIFAASSVEVRLDIGTILQEQPKISAADVYSLVVNIDQLPDGGYNAPLPTSLATLSGSSLLPPQITFRKARVNYTPFGAQAVYEFRDIIAKTVLDDAGNMTVDAGFLFNKKRFQLDALVQPMRENKTFAVQTTLANSKNAEEKMVFQGELGSKENSFFAKGVMDYHVTDLPRWLGFVDLSGVGSGLYDAFVDYKLQGKMQVGYADKELLLDMQQATLNGEALKMKLRAMLHNTIQFSLNAELEKLQFVDTNFSVNIYDLLKRVLVKSVEGDIQFAVGELQYYDMTLRDVQFEGMLIEQELIINKSVLQLSGDTNMLVFGIVRRDQDDIVNLDGNIEIIGKDFQKFISELQLDEQHFMQEYEGEFRAKSNIYFSPSLSLFSEMRFQVANVFVDGNAEYKPEGPLHYNFNLRARQLELDKVADYVNPFLQKKELDGGYGLNKFQLPFLANIHKNYRFDIALDGFSVWGERGRSSKIVFDVSPNQLRFSDVNLNVGNVQIKGNIALNQSGDTPAINGALYVSQWDANAWFGDGFRRYPVERGNVISVWKDEPFDISFMQGYDGKLRLNIGVLNYDAFVMRDVVFDAVIDGGEWRISELSAALWGGELKAKGTMDIASILSTNMDFVLKGVLLEQFLQSSLNIAALQGRVNMYGTINTGGLSVTNLVDSLQGQMVMSGQEISMSGFDLAGMIQTLPTIRNLSDVANTVRVSLLGGKTTFNAIEGAFYFDAGLFKSHGVKLRSKHAIGTIKGEANLLSWGMDYALSLKLPTLVVGDVAELTLFFKESMDDPLISVDSRQLESFMAKRKAVR